jgi:hypothetical protein
MCGGSPMLSLAWKGLNHGPALTLGFDIVIWVLLSRILRYFCALKLNSSLQSAETGYS